MVADRVIPLRGMLAAGVAIVAAAVLLTRPAAVPPRQLLARTTPGGARVVAWWRSPDATHLSPPCETHGFLSVEAEVAPGEAVGTEDAVPGPIRRSSDARLAVRAVPVGNTGRSLLVVHSGGPEVVDAEVGGVSVDRMAVVANWAVLEVAGPSWTVRAADSPATSAVSSTDPVSLGCLSSQT
ncbi:MAG: hypothetical protein WDA71_02580 [Actinomycetota bacterium]